MNGANAMNGTTAIVVIILLAAVILAIRSLVKRKKETGSAFGCGGSCASCPYAADCKKPEKKE